MKSDPIFLAADDIRAATFIRHTEIHDTLGSTNDRAAILARDINIELPALIAARRQTDGRGRGKHTWSSAEGALAFSVLLDPAQFGITTADWPQLSLATAVAVCDALAIELNLPVGHNISTHPNPQSEIRNPKSPAVAIKWPNDVLLHGEKVCGILIESPAGSSPAKGRLIVGIGINVNNSMRAPQPAARTVTQLDANRIVAAALHDVTNRTHDIQKLLCEVLCSMQTRYSQLAAHDPQLPGQWQRLCYLTQRNVAVETNGTRIEGVCLGLDESGRLLVENDSGTHRVTTGSVRLR